MARQRGSGVLYTVDVDDAHLKAWFNSFTNGEVIEKIDDKVETITRDTANAIARGAPVDTGHLKSTLWASRSVVKLGDGDWQQRNLTPYGIRQNFEHRHGNRYFMTNPIEKAEATFTKDIYDAIMELIE